MIENRTCRKCIYKDICKYKGDLDEVYSGNLITVFMDLKCNKYNDGETDTKCRNKVF